MKKCFLVSIFFLLFHAKTLFPLNINVLGSPGSATFLFASSFVATSGLKNVNIVPSGTVDGMLLYEMSKDEDLFTIATVDFPSLKEKKIYFVAPLAIQPLLIVTRKDVPFRSLKDIGEDVKVGAKTPNKSLNSIIKEILEKEGVIKYREVAFLPHTVIRDILEGKVDIAIGVVPGVLRQQPSEIRKDLKILSLTKVYQSKIGTPVLKVTFEDEIEKSEIIAPCLLFGLWTKSPSVVEMMKPYVNAFFEKFDEYQKITGAFLNFSKEEVIEIFQKALP